MNSLNDWQWVVGVDAHKKSFTYLLLRVGQGGAVIEEAPAGCLPNNSAGYDQLLQVLTGKSPVVLAIENARGYALGLSWHLLQAGQVVYDIPATQVASLRKRRQKAKNDCADARLVALAWLDPHQQEQRSPLQLSTAALQMQCLERCRESLVQQKVALQQQLAALARQPYASTQVQQSLAAVLHTLEVQIRGLAETLGALLEPYPTLQEAVGVGVVTASVLIGEVQDIQRFRSEAAFASYAGIAWRF